MPLHESEAIVLRCYDLAEADRIAVLFTRDFGKIRGVAVGAKRIKSNFVGSLDTAAHVRVKFFEKEGVDLARIKQCQLIGHFLKHPELSTSLYLMYMTELLEEFSTEHNANEDLFRLVLATFSTLQMGLDLELLARYFEFWVLRLEGVWPNARSCAICSVSLADKSGYFSQTGGVFTCARCKPEGALTLDQADYDVLQKFSRHAPGELPAGKVRPSSLGKLEMISQALMRRHLERDIKSYRLVKELASVC